jgi:hypothetical protein
MSEDSCEYPGTTESTDGHSFSLHAELDAFNVSGNNVGVPNAAALVGDSPLVFVIAGDSEGRVAASEELMATIS